MLDLTCLLLMFLAGGILGVMYFTGLWLTVQRLHDGKYPVLWLMSSMAVRMVLLLTAFYFILHSGDWKHLLAVLAGFIAARMFYSRRMRTRLSASAPLPPL